MTIHRIHEERTEALQANAESELLQLLRELAPHVDAIWADWNTFGSRYHGADQDDISHSEEKDDRGGLRLV